ncbi:MAG TPA: hypothetical protein PLH94_14660 [Fimbriimonadaceae bacterium]|nr:hypothetical protein [Fimbriimonadaceae bacterium]
MSLSVTRAKVKEKAGIDVTDFDAAIDNLIADWIPVIEYALLPWALADTGNAGLQATLNLGAAELIAGEFLAQIGRKPGVLDAIQIGDLVLSPLRRVPSDAYGLKEQGAARLRPYVRFDPIAPTPAPIAASQGKKGRDEEDAA